MCVALVPLDERVDQLGLANARLATDQDHLPTRHFDTRQGTIQKVEFNFSLQKHCDTLPTQQTTRAPAVPMGHLRHGRAWPIGHPYVALLLYLWVRIGLGAVVSG